MKKQRRGKFTYIPKDEIAEVTTFNDVTFENDDLLDGAYVKGRKKYARGGTMRAMPLEEQAAEAVGYDVWFSLPDMEKAELVEELVKSGTIVPTASETDVRIMELIEQDNYADGGEIEVGDFVKYKKAKYHATVLDVVYDVEIPYAKIEYPNGMIVTAYLEDLRKVILGVAPEYVNPNYMADGGNISDSKISDFKNRVKERYGKDEENFSPEPTMKEINKAVSMFLDWIDSKQKKFNPKDMQNVSIVGDIMLYNRGEAFYNLSHEKEVKEVLKSVKPQTAKLARGGFNVGRWYRDSSGEEFKYVGEDMKGNPLFNDGARTMMKPYEDFDYVEESSAFSWFAKGGVATEGKFLVKYYLKEEPTEFKEKIFDDRDKAELFFETIQDDDDIVVMPIEDYRESRPVAEMSTTVFDKVIAEKAAEKAAAGKPKNLFSAAKPVPVAKTAAKKRERVQVDGISDEIERYDALKAIINNAKAEQEIIGGRLKEIGREKFLDLYEDRGFRPANFDLADGNENILLEVTDKYLKVEPEKAAILEQYDGLLEVKTTYEFNPEILEKSVSDSMTVGDVVSMLIQDSNLLSDSDKENLIKAKTTMRVPKGTIDRLLDYDNPREVFNLISPILALK
jgi:hypothetical protein